MNNIVKFKNRMDIVFFSSAIEVILFLFLYIFFCLYWKVTLYIEMYFAFVSIFKVLILSFVLCYLNGIAFKAVVKNGAGRSVCMYVNKATNYMFYLLFALYHGAFVHFLLSFWGGVHKSLGSLLMAIAIGTGALFFRIVWRRRHVVAQLIPEKDYL